MLPREDSPIAPTPGIVSANPQQAAIRDHPTDSFRNPSYRHLILLWRPKNEGMTEGTPRGGVTFWRGITEGTAQATAWLSELPAGDKFFFYPYLQMLPFLLDRQQVSKYDLFIPGYTTPEQYQETCFNVMREATWVVIDRTFREDPQILLEAFPSLHDPSRPEMRRFEEALDEAFEPVRRFGVIEIRRRRGQPSETACAGIAR